MPIDVALLGRGMPSFLTRPSGTSDTLRRARSRITNNMMKEKCE